MKLAEALILPKDYEKNLEQLESRIVDNCKFSKETIRQKIPKS
ncbi:unnamed protein product [Debaryomyces tyrocola]|nr:unnamed protein product [Debaryomyces tyrocola]